MTRCGLQCIKKLFDSIKRMIRNNEIHRNEKDQALRDVLRQFDDAASGLIKRSKKRA